MLLLLAIPFMCLTLGTAQRADDGLREKFACFSTIFEIECGNKGEVLVFDSAHYGRNNTEVARLCGTPYQSNCDIDVHFTINRACAGKSRCYLAVNTQLFGDPCGYDEFLVVRYQCVAGRMISQTCGEDATPPILGHGYISSPNYPDSYFRDARCTWSLEVQRRQSIRVTILDFELDVNKGGVCLDYLQISAPKGPDDVRLYYKECGTQGRRDIFVDSYQATVQFQTVRNSLTQRGFLLRFTAVGPGCSDLQDLDHGHVLYYINRDTLYANASCEPGYIFLGTSVDSQQARCVGTFWDKAVTTCIAPPPLTTPNGVSLTSTAESTAEVPTLTVGPSSGGTDPDYVGISVALGLICTLLIIVLCLVTVLLCRRRKRQRNIPNPKIQSGFVVNNLQDNEFNEGLYKRTMIYGDTVDQHGKTRKKKKKNHNNADDTPCRNLLMTSMGPDDELSVDYTDFTMALHGTPIMPACNESTTYFSKTPSRRGSSRGFLPRRKSKEGVLENSVIDTTFCNECGLRSAVTTPRRPQSQKDLSHKRTRSGQFQNKAYAKTPSPDVPNYGFPPQRHCVSLTQSAPDLTCVVVESTQRPPPCTYDRRPGTANEFKVFTPRQNTLTFY